MRSMTGFGRGEHDTEFGRIVIELRAVNHRYLDVRVRCSREVVDVTAYAEQLAREAIGRGRIDVHVRLETTPEAAPTVALDADRARAAFRALSALRDELTPGEAVPLALLASVPDLFSSSFDRQADATREACRGAFARAIEALHAMRANEGLALASDLATRLASVRRALDDITARVPSVAQAHEKRMRARIARFVDDAAGLDAGRLEQEIALLLDRSDIAEELTRLSAHCAQFDSVCKTHDQCGRKLDFLLQEMSREANTIGSKAQDADIAHAVVELKCELERMREQVQNVE